MNGCFTYQPPTAKTRLQSAYGYKSAYASRK